MPMQRRDFSPRLLGFARRMRKQSTDAEKKIWALLRGGRMDGLKFRRQHPVAGYILDFYCEKHRLAIELDGNQHAEDDAVAYDQKRTEALSKLGIRVLRFSDHDVMRDAEAVAMTVLREVETFSQSPSPQPSPKGRGGPDTPSPFGRGLG